MSIARPEALACLTGLLPSALPIGVLDVGANPIEGDAPYQALMQAGLARVTGFEPQEGPLAELNARKSAAETYLPNALGRGGEAELHLCRHSGFTSLFRVRGDVARLLGFGRGAQHTGSVTVTTSRLDDLSLPDRVDYLKIDVQGAERDIISFGRRTLSEAVLVQAEVRFVPLYQDEPGFGELDRELRDQGFMFHDFAFLKRVGLRSDSHGALRPRFNRQVVDGDAFYIRDLTRIDTLSDAQLLRLAVLAEGVVDSPNLVVFCLDALVARGAISGDVPAAYLAAVPEMMKRGG